jgi:hypothetical protein
MTTLPISREKAEYRGFGLQAYFTQPQWQVQITAPAGKPPLPVEKDTVRGWDEEETMNRAKMRIDLMIESPSLS